jgi:hypothetical protein
METEDSYTSEVTMTRLQHPFPRKVLFAAALFIFGSCSDRIMPVAPTWDVDLSVPLTSHTYTLEELLSGDSSVTIREGDADMIIFGKSYPIDNIGIGDNLTMADNGYSFSRTLGELTYDIPDVLDKTLSVISIFPPLHTGSMIVPPITNSSSIDVNIDAQLYFEEITFESGKVLFELRNTSSIPMTFPKPALLLDEQQQVLASITIPVVLQPGEKLTLPPVMLNGVTLYHAMQLSLFIATPGSDGGSVEIRGDMGLEIHASLVDTRIRSAIASFPSQKIEYSEKLDICGDGETRFQGGKIAAGRLTLTLQNWVGVASTIDVVLNGILLNNAPLRESVFIESRSAKTVVVDLAGGVIQPTEERYIPYSLVVRTEDASNRMVFMTSLDSLSAVAAISDVRFEYVTGRIPPREVTFNETVPMDMSIDSRLTGTIRYSEAKMWAVLRNKTGLPVDINGGTLTGRNNGSAASASLTIQPVSILAGSEATLPFEDGEVTEFFNTFSVKSPNMLEISGSGVVNKSQGYGTATSRDKLEGVVYTEIPMRFTIEKADYLDTAKVVINESSIQDIDDVQEGLIVIDVENRFPTGFTIESELLDEGYNHVFTIASETGEPLTVRAAEIGPTGISIAPSFEKIQIRIVGEDLKRFTQSKYIRLKLSLNNNTAAPVVFRTTDYIKVTAYATFNVRANFVSK